MTNATHNNGNANSFVTIHNVSGTRFYAIANQGHYRIGHRFNGSGWMISSRHMRGNLDYADYSLSSYGNMSYLQSGSCSSIAYVSGGSFQAYGRSSTNYGYQSA